MICHSVYIMCHVMSPHKRGEIIPATFPGCDKIKKLKTTDKIQCPWWRYKMETFSVLLAICAGTAQRPVTRSFDVFFDLRLNKRLSKQSWCWWFETQSRPLWRHCDEILWGFSIWKYGVMICMFLFEHGITTGVVMHVSKWDTYFLMTYLGCHKCLVCFSDNHNRHRW